MCFLVNVFLYCLSSLDHERVALGNEEGLYVVHVTKDGMFICLDSLNVAEFAFPVCKVTVYR